MRKSCRWFCLLAGFGSAAFATQVQVQAEPGQIGNFKILPHSSTEMGVSGVFGDAGYFGAFNGMNDESAYGLINTDLLLRDDRAGTWIRLTGADLGLDNRELRFEHEKQGDWKYFIDLSQSIFSNPLEVTTGLTGIGGPTQNVAGTALRSVDLDVGRDQIKVGFGKIFGNNIDVNLAVRHEEKRGERQWGAQGFNFLTEPIDFVSREITGTANYTGDRLQLTGGYLGSFFSNDNEVLNNNSSQTMISLPADNQAHQVRLAGGYGLTPTTRATFKVSYGVALQNETFFTAPTFAGNSRRDLGGRVDTTLAQLGLTARPLPKLGLTARLRYEDRDDKTERAQYITTTATRSGLNIPFSRTTTTGDLEASYTLPMRYRLIGRVKQEHWSRSKPNLRQASFRDNTNETSYGIELRRSLVNGVGGSLAYTRSERTGSNFANGTDSRIDAINLGDRERDKIGLSLNWAPSEKISTQLRLEYSSDAYDSRPLGPRDGETKFVSLDINYSLSKMWNLSAWASLNDFRLDQATNGDGTSIVGAAVTDEDWAADLRHVGKAIGVALRGQLTKGLSTGLDVQYSTDRSEQNITGLGPSVLPTLPDIRYRQANLGLFFDYKVAPKGRIRLNYGYSRIAADDWTWQGFVYADGTSVVIPEREETHFVGLAYSHRW
jgi:MtrB/PioB family decaheme-associated outer membrane protein